MEFYTIIEAAEVLKVSYRTLQRYLYEGKLNYTKLIGRVYIRKEDVINFALRIK